jgi:hypothetical protein
MTDGELPAALDSIANEIDRARSRVLRLVADRTPTQADWRPRAGEWSIAEVLDHLIRAEENSARLIAGLAKRAPAVPYPDDVTEFAWTPPTADEYWNVRVPALSAEPSSGKPLPALREKLTQQGVLTRRALVRLATIDPRTVTFAHALIEEPMNLGQWGRFIAYHLDVHARQIEDLDRAYPR